MVGRTPRSDGVRGGVGRLDLYKAMGVQSPATPEDEPATGRALTELVLRGTGGWKPAHT